MDRYKSSPSGGKLHTATRRSVFFFSYMFFFSSVKKMESSTAALLFFLSTLLSLSFSLRDVCGQVDHTRVFIDSICSFIP